MSCRFSDDDGKCQLYDGSIEMPGVDENRICICEDAQSLWIRVRIIRKDRQV